MSASAITATPNAAGAGTGATVGITNFSDDEFGELSITSGTATGAANTLLATVNLTGSWNNYLERPAPLTVDLIESNAAAAFAGAKWYGVLSTDGYTLTVFNSAVLPVSTGPMKVRWRVHG